jgi:ADP-ribosylglycohydrolase
MLDELAVRFLPVVIGARVGDAMGTPTEAMDPGQIREQFGWVSDFAGDGTDDSLMATFLADALIETNGEAGADDWATQLLRHRDLVRAKQDKFFVSVLHTLEKLEYGWSPRSVAAGNMPSSSSAMCIWPVGLVNAGDPSSAAGQAYALAALIHVGDVDFCQDAAAAIAAAVAAALRPGTSMTDACSIAMEVLHPISALPMRTLIVGALRLAEESGGYEEFRDRYHASHQQTIFCDSRETVPAALALAVLANGELERAVEYAANFGRDTDTIASMTGALCGAASDAQAPPESWIERLGPVAVRSATTLAGQLATTARRKATQRQLNVLTVPGLLTIEQARDDG